MTRTRSGQSLKHAIFMKAIHTDGPALLMFLATVCICFGQPLITNRPAPQATATGTTVTFQVGASSIEPLGYQWQKNPGNGFSNLTDRTNAALVLASVQAGEIVCWPSLPSSHPPLRSTGRFACASARLPAGLV